MKKLRRFYFSIRRIRYIFFNVLQIRLLLNYTVFVTYLLYTNISKKGGIKHLYVWLWK